LIILIFIFVILTKDSFRAREQFIRKMLNKNKIFFTFIQNVHIFSNFSHSFKFAFHMEKYYDTEKLKTNTINHQTKQTLSKQRRQSFSELTPICFVVF